MAEVTSSRKPQPACLRTALIAKLSSRDNSDVSVGQPMMSFFAGKAVGQLSFLVFPKPRPVQKHSKAFGVFFHLTTTESGVTWPRHCLLTTDTSLRCSPSKRSSSKRSSEMLCARVLSDLKRFVSGLKILSSSNCLSDIALLARLPFSLIFAIAWSRRHGDKQLAMALRIPFHVVLSLRTTAVRPNCCAVDHLRQHHR